VRIDHTGIEGLLRITLDVYGDERGSFRETYQEEKLEAAGFPKVTFIQTNISESDINVIRGIHAEPWDKYVHAAKGRGFAAIADFRRGSPTFGKVETFHLDASTAIFIPEGCGNSFGALTDNFVYVYQVTGLFVAGVKYPAVAYNDPTLGIDWPIRHPILSAKDQALPSFEEVFAV
jgi:dTDP-4-dehydrorhamnose 3,5-epimerase